MKAVVLDTNICVAAGFNPGSHAAKIIRALEDRRFDLVWDAPTRDETRHIVQKIPPLNWARFAALYEQFPMFPGQTAPEAFDAIPDRADRKFAALASAADAILISNDRHFLDIRDTLYIRILTPAAFWQQCV